MGASKDSVAWRFDPWAGVRGTRIVLQARKMSPVRVVHGSHTHKTHHVVGTENAEAWIEIPLRAVTERKPG